MIHAIYTLPEISFIGGESQLFLFDLRTLSGTDFDASDCRVGFALIHYANKNGLPILTKEATILMGDSGCMNIAKIELTSEDTIGLYGRYVYQITVADAHNRTEIPGHGIVDITRNIHPNFISN